MIPYPPLSFPKTNIHSILEHHPLLDKISKWSSDPNTFLPRKLSSANYQLHFLYLQPMWYLLLIYHRSLLVEYQWGREASEEGWKRWWYGSANYWAGFRVVGWLNSVVTQQGSLDDGQVSISPRNRATFSLLFMYYCRASISRPTHRDRSFVLEEEEEETASRYRRAVLTAVLITIDCSAQERVTFVSRTKREREVNRRE